MKYFIDTEFMEDGKTIELISIGIVSEDGRELKLYNSNADLHHANDWVKKHVLPYIPGVEVLGGVLGFSHQYSNPDFGWRPLSQIALEVQHFVHMSSENPEFWADWGSYDWVVFCQMYGMMVDLPKGYPMFIRDFQQLHHMCGKPDIPIKQINEHDVLEDAKYLKAKYDWLMENYTIKVEKNEK